MAFFKFRLPGQNAEPQGNFSQPASESVEAMRRRARHRLMGACVLVFIGVVVFPLIFDTQPRPVSVDIAIDIPDRAHSKAASPVATPAKPLETAAALDAKEEVVKADPQAASKVAEVTPQAKPEAKPEVKAEPKPDVKASDATKATETKTEAKPEVKDTPRFIVQVGAFSDEAKMREVRAKVEKSGLKTYTHVAETKEGKRTRVRVGPFTTREEADKVANKIKQLQLQPQVLTL